MARRGKFGAGVSGGSVAGNVIKSILRMQGTGDTAAPPGTTDGTNSKSKPLTAQRIASNPVFSGKLSVDQAKINYIKAQQALSLMPGEKVTGAKYDAQLKKANQAIANLGFNPIEAEQQFFALGGKMQGAGRAEGSNYGFSSQKVLEYYRAAGMEEKGYEVVAKMLGNDRYGNSVAQSQPTVEYKLGAGNALNVQSGNRNLTALQDARLTKLKNLKKGGSTLGAKQLANIKRLRALAKG